jgi:post-segregation antitoxin (ccd killing protein)
MSMRIRNNTNEFLGMQRMLESISPALKAAQISSTIAASIPSSLINQQIVSLTYPMREMTERWNQILNTAGMVDLTKATSRVSEVFKTPAILEANQAIQSIFQNSSVQMKFINTIKQLNIGIDPHILEVARDLAIDTSALGLAIQNNLRLFKEYDWSTIIDAEDLEDLKIESALDGAVIDINDGISFQQQLGEFINKLKSKYPLLLIIFYMFILSPIQSAVNDAVLDVIKGTTAAIAEQPLTNHKVMEKNIKIEVNKTLNIKIESIDARAEILKAYAYVSTEHLVIRQSNKVKSRVLYTLEFGQVVRIIHKDRKWTLVEYETEEGVIQGWVFTRYISKFNR